MIYFTNKELTVTFSIMKESVKSINFTIESVKVFKNKYDLINNLNLIENATDSIVTNTDSFSFTVSPLTDYGTYFYKVEFTDIDSNISGEKIGEFYVEESVILEEDVDSTKTVVYGVVLDHSGKPDNTCDIEVYNIKNNVIYKSNDIIKTRTNEEGYFVFKLTPSSLAEGDKYAFVFNKEKLYKVYVPESDVPLNFFNLIKKVILRRVLIKCYLQKLVTRNIVLHSSISKS